MLLALALAACGAWAGPRPLQTWPSVEASERMIALDRATWKLVAVQNVASERTADGRLHLRFELANLSADDLAVQVQVRFRDASGMPTGEDTPFEMIVLPGNGSRVYEVTSLRTDAERWTLQVRTP